MDSPIAASPIPNSPLTTRSTPPTSLDHTKTLTSIQTSIQNSIRQNWVNNEQILESQNLDKSMKDLNWLVNLNSLHARPSSNQESSISNGNHSIIKIETPSDDCTGQSSNVSSRPASGRSSRSKHASSGSRRQANNLSSASSPSIANSPISSALSDQMNSNLPSSSKYRSRAKSGPALSTNTKSPKKRQTARKSRPYTKKPKLSVEMSSQQISAGTDQNSKDQVEEPIGPISGIGLPEKPVHSYATLISLAISSSDKKMMTLSEIYTWICDNFPYFSNCLSKWKNSIRHNLSLNRNFIRVPRPKDESGKGSYWTTTKYRKLHAKALNELHQRQLMNLSESFRLLYEQSFQPILSESQSRVIDNEKAPVIINPRAKQIADSLLEASLSKKAAADAAKLANLQTKTNNNAAAYSHGIKGIGISPAQASASIAKQIDPLTKSFTRKELEPFNNLMQSFRQADENKWDITTEHLSDLYSGVNDLCKATGIKTGDLPVTLPESLDEYLININRSENDDIDDIRDLNPGAPGQVRPEDDDLNLNFDQINAQNAQNIQSTHQVNTRNTKDSLRDPLYSSNYPISTPSMRPGNSYTTLMQRARQDNFTDEIFDGNSELISTSRNQSNLNFLNSKLSMLESNNLVQGLGNFNDSKLLKQSYQNALDSILNPDAQSNDRDRSSSSTSKKITAPVSAVSSRSGPSSNGATIASSTSKKSSTGISSSETRAISEAIAKASGAPLNTITNSQTQGQGGSLMDNVPQECGTNEDDMFPWDELIEGEAIKMDDLNM